MTVIDTQPPMLARFRRARTQFLGAPFDPLTPENVLDMLRASGPDVPFRYVVTPNVDHVVRMRRDRTLRAYYDQAWISVCDSRPIVALGRLVSLRLPLVTGSDLTVVLFQSVIERGDVISVIAASDGLVQQLQAAYPDVVFRAHVPPPGVLTNDVAFQECVDFAANAKARFLFICIGSPQSEKIASALASDPRASGTAFCVGAALEFMVGTRARAPMWMRRVGLEWLHRLSTDPKRLWHRYASSVFPLLLLFKGEVTDRQKMDEMRP